MGQGYLGVLCCALDVHALRREADPSLGGQAWASGFYSDCILSMQLLWCL